MARIKLGPLVEDIRGTINNVVFSVAKGGKHYIKNPPASPHNPSTLDQGAARRQLQEAAKDWAGLSDVYKAMWEAVAARCAGLAKESGGGMEAIVPAIGFDGSGFNAYVAFRTRSLLTGVALADFNAAWQLGVDTEQQPSDDTITDLTCVGGTITSTVTAPLTADVAARIAVWIRGRKGVYHRQICFLNDTATLIQAYTQAKTVKGLVLPFADALDEVVIMQTQTVNPSGWASPGSNAREVLVV